MPVAHAHAVRDYEAQADGQLTVHAGDQLEVLDDAAGDGWRMVYCVSTASVGYLPVDIVKLVSDATADAAADKDDSALAYVRVYVGAFAPGDARESYRTLAVHETEPLSVVCAKAAQLFGQPAPVELRMVHHETGDIALLCDAVSESSPTVAMAIELAKALTAVSLFRLGRKPNARYWASNGKALKVNAVVKNAEKRSTMSNALALLADNALFRDGTTDYLSDYKFVLHAPDADMYIAIRDRSGSVDYAHCRGDTSVGELRHELHESSHLAIVRGETSVHLPMNLKMSAVLEMAENIDPSMLVLLEAD